MKGSIKKVGLALGLMLMTAGAYGQQSCNANITATAPDADFEVHGDGTVTDTDTGLMWSVCLAGQTHMLGGTCDGAAFEESWEQAHLTASGESVGGYSDWRLPNVNELVSILELQCEGSALNENIFPGVAGNTVLWTSTPTTQDGLANSVFIDVGVPGPDAMMAMYPFLLVREN
ncbi:MULTISPECIES: DUF1566 domain-containing protein [Gammaproteobacteria]|uniref:Lcl C-terminal domain-containing protein n=1 Tax=Gammaproteobacteria TaxID=1236 RepID=UPI000DD081D7|nr:MULTISPECIES: DUF1566 domain-containing protein [Gammaproteobacteria]RTE87763.1 DUF1566 domain-containing protein [Aliidiomarina sp. B3213]TCZ92455.1 DUF1566 domain-containing protein [Lysobacter sp. N42]